MNERGMKRLHLVRSIKCSLDPYQYLIAWEKFWGTSPTDKCFVPMSTNMVKYITGELHPTLVGMVPYNFFE